MQALIVGSLILAWFDLLLFATLLVNVHSGAAPWEPSHFTPVVIFLGGLVALATYATNDQRAHSRDQLDAASQLLRRAYEVLEQADDDGRPRGDRFNWLSAARFLTSAQDTAKGISESGHRVLYEEEREYYRRQFRVLIRPTEEGFPREYYEPLDEVSLAALHRFIGWPEQMNDPIGGVQAFTDNEIDQMVLLGPRNLGRFLREKSAQERQARADW